MADQMSRQELELLLDEKTVHIRNRIDALQAEVTTVGQLLRRTADERPLAMLGGAIGVGLLAGLLFGGRRKLRDPLKSNRAQRELADRYVEALSDHARAAVAADGDVGEAVRTAIANRVPLILYRAPKEGLGRGVLSSIFEILLGTVTSLAATMATNYLTSSLNEEPLQASGRYASPTESGEEGTSMHLPGGGY